MIQWLSKNAIKLLYLLSVTVVGLKADWASIYDRYLDHLETKDSFLVNSNKELLLEVKELREQFNECRNSWVEQQGEIDRLKNSVLLLEISNTDGVSWVKDRESTVLTISKGYVRYLLRPLGISANDFIGTKGYSHFPKEIVDEWVRRDSLVMFREEPEISIEHAPTGMKGLSIKKPLFSNGGVVLGTVGAWLDFELFKKDPKVLQDIINELKAE